MRLTVRLNRHSRANADVLPTNSDVIPATLDVIHANSDVIPAQEGIQRLATAIAKETCARQL